MERLRLRSHWGLLALLALTFAAAYPMQVNGWNQNAHYALVRALADGTPTIDRSRTEIGDLGTGDVSRFEGHVYSNKAPGLPLLSLPAFLVVDGLGMRTKGDPTRIIWALHLCTIVPAFLLALLLARRLADRMQPGYGAAAAVALGLGTLMLPFSTLYFAHVLSAALGLACFAVLWRGREGGAAVRSAIAGGALAGLAITVEYSLVIVAAIVGVYAMTSAPRAARALGYAGGVVAGALPLALYNQWAFGSPFHVSYANNAPGELSGFFGFVTPSARLLRDALVSTSGLLTLTPVLAMALVGAVVAVRGERKLEAAVAVAVAVAFLAWSISFVWEPFGGLGPPRYLIPMLPFLAILLAPSFRALPLTTLLLAGISSFQMAVITATNPLAVYDGDWLGRLADRDVSQTAASLVGITGWYAIVPFFAAALVAVASGARAATGVHLSYRELPIALLAVGLWAAIAVQAPNANGSELAAEYVLAVAGLLAVAALAGVAASRALVATAPGRISLRSR